MPHQTLPDILLPTSSVVDPHRADRLKTAGGAGGIGEPTAGALAHALRLPPTAPRLDGAAPASPQYGCQGHTAAAAPPPPAPAARHGLRHRERSPLPDALRLPAAATPAHHP
eukprot:scaffold217031_cov14-Tisochrysis_lutea.AAC.1